MKTFALSSSLLISLAMSALGQDQSALLSQISTKEKQLTEIQKELHNLRTQLSAPAPSTSSYTVKTGDTVHSIARNHKVAPADLIKWNKITDPTKLGIGQILVISGTAKPTVAADPKAPAAPSSKGYTVAKGDTFYSIARRNNMTLKQLKALNPDVSSHLIAPGQTIMVTGNPSQALAHTKTPPRKNYKIKEPTTKTIATKITTKEKPKETPKKEVVEKEPLPAPPTPPVVEEAKPTTTFTSIIVTEEVTFDDFAAKHGTTTDKLNGLNNWNLPKATVLARGSEVQIPK